VKRALLAASWLLLTAPAALAGDTLSLLALGDTGKGRLWPKSLRAQYRVGEALAREDRRAPVEALVFLGDNFYPRGLTPETLRARVGENLAAPYCHFLALTERGFAELGERCRRPPEATHPVPIVAVLGNHDVGLAQGVALQRTGIPAWIGNWLVPGTARSYELGAGVSLVAFHSPDVADGAAADALAAALRAARGPWLIVAAHHPVADPGAGWRSAYAERVRAALRAAGRPVHLFLAGHQHSLQALRAEGAALHVIAGGGGADLYPLAPSRGAERLFGVAAHGFARVDASPDALVVTLLALDGPFDRDAEPRARLRIRPDGGVETLPLR
jgi:hypothetical protein